MGLRKAKQRRIVGKTLRERTDIGRHWKMMTRSGRSLT